MAQRVQFCTTSDGVQIAYAVHGQGYPLILVPGWVSHLELDFELPHTRAALDDLARDFTVIRFDKRGTGLSDRGVKEFGLEARLLDLEALTSAVGIRRYAMRGVSEGGPVAIAHAVQHAEAVSHLVLLGTYAHLGHSPAADALISLISAEWGLGSTTMANIFVPSASKELQENFVRYQREAASRTAAAAMLAANVETDVREMLPKVVAPTLVIHSETDKAVPFQHARVLAGSIPRASLAQYKGDHAPLDQWPEINAALREFVLGTPPAGPQRPQSASGLMTIMFTDIEASTTMTRTLGDAAAQDVLRRHNEIIRRALRENGGMEIKHTGDGIMASFGSASSALMCAGAVQRAFAAAEEGELRVRVRVGLNAGEPVAEDGDLFGTAVQVAARICARAEPGQVLVANVVRELAAGKRFLFADVGEVVLRGFEDPVRLYEMRWDADDAPD